ncbi:zinc finger MYM-type protein 4 isoform X1 [Thunnus maccoyii]|uniref:zinc finger MYM-type protein 4 isoform X1 n=1 Tax=Thunnus maccoyii TaxID=8240 RepID=UPI001C4CCDBA|nr:zinc finger MYM-type protein 4 isoform X1 [Thunnus maccoyii]
MAATETSDGHHRLANQVSSVRDAGAVTEGADGESIEAAVDAGASADVGDTELVPGSSRLSEHEEDNNFVAAKEMESKELGHKETEAEVVPLPVSVSLLNPSPSHSSFSTQETVNTVLVHSGGPDSTSESEKEGTEVKTEEGFESNEENVTVKGKSLEESPAGPDVSEDTNMDTTPSGQEEKTNTDEKMDSDTDTKENIVAQEENESLSCNLRVSTADDLDEMMDIGTVDEVEQEAQMKEEEQSNLSDGDRRSSPAISNTVSVAEDGNSFEDETDVKPTVLPPPTENDQSEDVKMSLDLMQSSSSPSSEATASTVSVAEDGNSFEDETDVKPTVLPPPTESDQSEDVKMSLDMMQSSSSPSSKATASTGRESSSPATTVNGTKVVKLSKPRSDNERSQAAAQPIKSSPSPPLVKVKDEPIDEDYEQALISSTSTANVKDEPNTAKEDLRIGSVFSVTPAAETQTLPIVHPSSLHMSCSHCKKNLMKGQTAFQRKGSPALFCSTTCLTTSLPTVKGVSKICFNCQKVILRPQDVILAPDSKGAMKEFCSQNCLTSFNYKKNNSNVKKIPPPQKTVQPQSLCSMCTRYCTSKHEVILSGAVHKMCSDACFNRFRTVNNLSMAGCANCGSYYHNKPLLLKMEDSNKTLCNAACLNKYKEKTKTPQPCTMCRTSRPLTEMVDHRNLDDSVNLFCSSSCVMAYMVQTVSSSGARLNCDNCGKNTVPAYHLAMSDTSIRNFCTLQCVMAFQEKFKNSHKQVNIFTKLPIGTTQIQSIIPNQTVQEVPKAPAVLNCSQCSRKITFKPELIQIKDKMVFVCSVDCSQEFKKVNFVTSLCEYCKIEKITRDTKKINNKDCYFCSDGCKLLFRHDLSKGWGKHCHSCSYCHSVSKKLVTAQYGGATEEFCSEECRSKYTMLFCHVAKCDTCGCKGKLKQSLPMLGEVKHFCDMKCLLQFCCDKVSTQGEVFKGTEEATPIIANVVSLAGTPTGKPTAPNRTAQQSTVTDFQSKNSGHISIQTDTVKPHPPSGPKILKNKALLCRPLVQNKGVSCKTQTVDVEAQTDDVLPKILVLPVPVPVYVPVPMSMYSQCTPKPVGLPFPLPVPMFLPVTMDSAERIVETIQEIKEKIPSDPFEAELILMAEMVAEQEEEKNDKQEEPKEKAVEKETDRQEAPAPDDHASNYSDDLDTDDLDSFLNNWEEPSPDAGLRSPSRLYAHEKLNPIIDIPVGMPSEPFSEPPPPAPPPMDVESDFTVETLEKMSRLREESQRSPSPPPATSQRRRRQVHRKAREKKGRKSQRLTKAAETTSQKDSPDKTAAAEIPKLKSQYGVDAWKRWIQWRQTQPNLEKPRFGSRPMELKEDILRCTTAELSYGLCCFITEVKRPNGEPYSPDSLFYLCLGIQQHLFENGRVENIFMDRFYNKFSTEFTNMLRGFKPLITASGYIHSRVEEEFLWDCKQLGAYSPIVLLNTLLFFCCKYFGFTTVEQHRQLSFAHVMRCTKTNQNNTKTTFLRFYPPISINEAESDPEGVPAKRRKEEESKEDILEMRENTENPLRCPVRLYEFYLSKCSESVKQRTNLFYLHPERCCVPNSPLWFSSSPLDDSTMEAMLIRILTVRELHLKTKKDEGTEQQTPEDPPFIPEEEEDEESE